MEEPELFRNYSFHRSKIISPSSLLREYTNPLKKSEKENESVSQRIELIRLPKRRFARSVKTDRIAEEQLVSRASVCGATKSCEWRRKKRHWDTLNKSEGNRLKLEGGRERRASKKRPEGLLAECGLEKWGHVFSVKLLES
nr:PREDICTED: uncharacterized protein LOC105662502 isoform X1 [Megachile rotundata]